MNFYKHRAQQSSVLRWLQYRRAVVQAAVFSLYNIKNRGNSMSIKTDKYCTKKIEGILNDSINIKHLEGHKPDGYDYTYGILLEYFECLKSLQEEEKWLIGGASLVYSWMPTILDFRGGSIADALSPLHIIINHKNKYFYQDDKIIEGQLEPLRIFINDSIVGTSKFLHFSFPGIFPIWDSRVAKAIGFSTSILHNKTNNNDIKHYVAYARSIHKICKKKKHIVELLDDIKLLKNKTCIRQVEQALFLIGGMNEDEDEKKSN